MKSAIHSAFQSIMKAMKTQNKNDDIKEQVADPMHCGEVYMLWFYANAVMEFMSFEEISRNTTTDQELYKYILDIQLTCENHIKELQEFFQKEAISFPRQYGAKPQASPNDIPMGAKMSDDEISNLLSIKIFAIFNICSQGLTQSLRSDIGVIWVGFMKDWLMVATDIKSLLIKRSWIKIPPLFYGK